MNVESQKVSSVITLESIRVTSDQAANVLDFDWSPDGTQLSYIAFLGGARPAISGYTATINCHMPEYTCKVTDQKVLTWIGMWCELSWAPDSSSLFCGYIDKEHQHNIVEIRDPNGRLINRIDLADYLPTLPVSSPIEAVPSPDSSRIAFVALEGDTLGLFVLNLDTKIVMEITRNVNPVGIKWFP